MIRPRKFNSLALIALAALTIVMSGCGGGGGGGVGGGASGTTTAPPSPGTLSISQDASLSNLAGGTLVLSSTGSNQILFRSYSFDPFSQRFDELRLVLNGNFNLPNLSALTGSPLSNASGTLFQVSQTTGFNDFRVLDLNLPLSSVLPWVTSGDWRNFWLSISVNGLNGVASGGTRKLTCSVNNTSINLTSTPTNITAFVQSCTRA